MHYTTLYATNTIRLRPWNPGYRKDTNVNWSLKARAWWGIRLQHRLSVQRSADGIDMWLTFSHPCVQIVYLGYIWILRNVDKKCFFKSENFEFEIMKCGIHFFIQNQTPELMSSHGVPLMLKFKHINFQLQMTKNSYL